MKSFYIYQKERFPIIVNLILIGSFTFSALSFSKNLRVEEYSVDWNIFFSGLVITFTTFFLIRIIDEFKDFESDKEHRPHLPVQRGIISLGKLKIVGVVLFSIQLGVIVFLLPKIWMFYLLMMGYLFMMSFEFFIPKWLNNHTIAYTTSHMVIVALIDFFASTLDWGMVSVFAPKGLYILVVVSFFNGLVIELGRKIKAPENEDYNSYTRLYGIKNSVLIWLGVMLATLVSATIATHYANYESTSYLILTAIFLISCYLGFSLIKSPTKNKSKLVEIVSAIWTLVMYLIVGCYPQLRALIETYII